MCELLGGSLKKNIDIREYLIKFYAHSIHHPHGWGLMRFTDNRHEIIKEPVCASESLMLNDIIESTQPQKNFLAHIRLATVGSKKQENSHPFTGNDISGRTWSLIHNGTVYSSGKLIKYLNTQTGDTDSERVFLYLIDLLNDEIKIHGELDQVQRFNIVNKLIMQLSGRNKLNLLIFDGEILYVHKNMKNTLSIKQNDDGIIISTQPLDDDFEDYPLCTIRAYRDGEFLFESEKKTAEFVPTLEYISAMAALNI